MYIEATKNNGTRYLRLVRGVRITNSQGVRTVTKRVVFNIGPLSRFDDGEPNYLERLKASFKNGTPLIPSLVPYVGDSTMQTHLIRYQDGDPACEGNPKRLAPCVLDPIFSAIGLDQFFASVKHSSKMHYDLQGIVKLLVYGRLLDPASKWATMLQNKEYLNPIAKKYKDDSVYDVLSVIDKNAQKIFRRMNTCLMRGIGRNPSMIFYDVTNFFFETSYADEDILDEQGNVEEKGLRKFGVSKENRKQPIVQVGLFMDDNGIPISFKMFPGNMLDHNTLRPAMKESVDTFELGRFVLVADRGMYNGTNMCHVTDAGNGYIVSKSLRKSTTAERKWAISSEGWTVVSDKFRYKSQIKERIIIDECGTKRKIKEKIVVYWSKAFYDREVFENKKFLDFVERLKANPAGFRVTSAQSRSLKKFLKKDVLNSKNGEILDGTKLVAMIDEEKLNEFNELMGYYQIATSELEMDDRAVIDKYHGLTQIEDQFREMKSTLETRPMFVNTPEHINAHLMICFIALTMMRLIQRKISLSRPKDDNEDIKWSYGISGERIAKALKEWQVLCHPGELFQMLNSSNEDIRCILSALNVNLKPMIYSKGDILSLKMMVNPF